jgi:hypothetical protein
LTYRIRPLLLGEAEVPNVLDVFWSLSADHGRSSVPILGFLILGAEQSPIVVDCGMRDPSARWKSIASARTPVHPSNRCRRSSPCMALRRPMSKP